MVVLVWEHTPLDDKNKLILGYRNYELSNHLGNVLAVISDKDAEIVSANDYYPFGMTIESRSFSDGYRFGFNGKENDKDLGEGSVDFGARIYDYRASRFLSQDPLIAEFPWSTPYSFAANNPIALIDRKGESPQPPTPPDYSPTLNAMIRQLDIQLKEGYKQTYFMNGLPGEITAVREYSGMITFDDSPTGERSYKIENYTPGPIYGMTDKETPNVQLDFTGIDFSKLAGYFHYHPMHRRIGKNNGNYSSAHSGQDIKILYRQLFMGKFIGRENLREGNFSMVDAGVARFTVVIENVRLVKRFFNKLIREYRKENSLTKYAGPNIHDIVISEEFKDFIQKKIYENYEPEGDDTHTDTYSNAVRDFLGDSSESGLGYYRTNDDEAVKFEKQN